MTRLLFFCAALLAGGAHAQQPATPENVTPNAPPAPAAPVAPAATAPDSVAPADISAATDTVAAAFAQARERRVPVVVDFHAPWCYSCYYMARHVLTGPEWDRVKREAVIVELDADSPEGALWMATWSVKAMPTYIVFGADGQERGRMLGEQTRVEFFPWLNAMLGSDSLEALKAKFVDGSEESLAAARELLRAYHARYDAAGGLGWFVAQAPKQRVALARDKVTSTWIARLELQRAVSEKDVVGCLNVAPMVMQAALGCERPYELSKVMECSAGRPEAERRELLKPQVELMQLLLDKRVFADYRCADERSIVTGAADLHKALGDPQAEALVLERAIADVKRRLGDKLESDRNLADNLRVYLDRAGRTAEHDALLVKLIAAYPDDYVYAYRHAKSLAARGLHADALPFFEQADVRAYGVNKLRNAELRAKSLQALNRGGEARQVLEVALKDNGAFFPEDGKRVQALLETLLPPPPKMPATPATPATPPGA